MSVPVPSSKEDYCIARFYDSCESEKILVDGNIMPYRNDDPPSLCADGRNSKKCIRGEDILFLKEAVYSRRNISGETPTGVINEGIQPYLRASDWNDVVTELGSIWNYWASTDKLTDYAGTAWDHNVSPSPSMDLDTLASAIRIGTNFDSGIGTRESSGLIFEAGCTTGKLKSTDELMLLFKDIAKKQCCILGLYGDDSPSYFSNFSCTTTNNYGECRSFTIEENTVYDEGQSSEFITDCGGDLLITGNVPCWLSRSKIRFYVPVSYSFYDLPADAKKEDIKWSYDCLVRVSDWTEVTEGELSLTIPRETVVRATAALTGKEARPSHRPGALMAGWVYLIDYLQNYGSVLALVELSHTNIKDILENQTV